MQLDLDTFLTTVYCIVDDLYKEHFAPLKPVRRGRKPRLSDSEVLTLALIAQWQEGRSESAFLRYAHNHWRSYFPQLLSQSAFNRRARDLAGVLCRLGVLAAQQAGKLLAHGPAYQALDGVAVPLMRRCRGDRHRLFAEEAAIGRGGSDGEWYYGVKLLLSVEAAGLITGFVFAPANTAEHWLAEALLCWRCYPQAAAPKAQQLEALLGPSHKRGGTRVGPTGPIACPWSAGQPWHGAYVADLGFRGKHWAQHWQSHYGARVLTRADYAHLACQQRRRWTRWLAGLRQVVETVNGCLSEVLGLKFPRARSFWSLLTRISAKVAAFNIAVHINLLCHRPTFSLFNPLQ